MDEVLVESWNWIVNVFDIGGAANETYLPAGDWAGRKKTGRCMLHRHTPLSIIKL
ncbi:MAG: hypothetical protein HN413_09780 [Chloroflexi bacterium]|nr:hypothetical protein [Chloroflexota bacterium]